MINLKNNSECCGCTACKSICPKNAITMKENSEGFKYPIVDKEKCIDCGLCEKVCPYTNEYIKKVTLKNTLAYGGWNKNPNIRDTSTSGGIFSAIAKYILDNNGIVCGAVYDKDLNVIHDIIDSIEDLSRINGSKYVQSDMKDTFKIVKQELLNGRLVLFSGTPCQVSGLNSFLGKEYDNLYTCDIICHGVPSPKVYKKYISELEEKNNAKLISINFRDKVSGWRGYSLSAKFNNNTSYTIKAKKTTYMKAFLDDIDLRESCPTCKFAKLPRYVDFTLGDFWGVDNYYPELNKDNKGTSLILVHTDKGKKILLDNPDCFIKECDINNSISSNPSVIKHSPANKNRDKFFNELDNTDLNNLVKKYVHSKSIIKKIYTRILAKLKHK